MLVTFVTDNVILAVKKDKSVTDILNQTGYGQWNGKIGWRLLTLVDLICLTLSNFDPHRLDSYLKT